MTERKLLFILGTLALIVLCGTIVFCFLWFALWAYHEIIALTTFGVVLGSFVLWRVVEARGKLTEQDMRLERYRYREEIPLDEMGEPLYLPGDAQPNSNHIRQHH